MYISPELERKLQQKTAQFKAAAVQGAQVSDTTWQYYVDSENQLIDLMNGNPPSEEANGSIEASWILYFLNNDANWELRDILRYGFGMPGSQITPDDWTSWEQVWSTDGVLFGDGSVVSEAKYALMDPDWSIAFLNYLLLDLGADLDLGDLDPVTLYTPFGTTPADTTYDAAGPVTVALFSDWAAGNYSDGNLTDSPAVLVSQQITALSPDIVIHLGDTYYTGNSAEMQSNLLDYWPGNTSYNYTLNGNHEMYDGDQGLYTTALAASTFAQQNGTTYFSITVGNWLLVGLDTAYYDPSTLYMQGALVDANQISFLNAIGQQVQGGKSLILLTHHNPLFTDASQLNPLYDQVMQALGGFTTPQESYTIQPTYWYWGHVHNGIVYKLNTLTGDINCRCIGHAAIPIGNASWLDGNDNVEFYTNTALPDPTPDQQLRVMNGFMTLTIATDGTVTETFYNQDGSVAWPSAAS